nr:PE family protein [Mycobacterium tuberculosis]
MSFVLIAPEFVTAAAGDLTNLGSSISAANASAASATTQVLAAGADEVSARIAALFGGFGLEYQAISAQLTAAQSASSHPTTLGGYPWPVGSTGWRWPSDR